MKNDIMKMIDRLIKECVMELSEVTIDESEEYISYNIDNVIEIYIDTINDAFGVDLIVGASDIEDDADEDDIQTSIYHQEAILIISQFLYVRLDKKPSINTVFQGICPYPDSIISFTGIPLNNRNLYLYLHNIIIAFNYLVFKEVSLFKGINYYAVIKASERNFPEEGEFLVQINGLLKKLQNSVIENKNSDFCKSIFSIIHDFTYYTRQAAEALFNFNEERIRDLLLIPLRMIFSNVDGEVYNYDGKSDFKIVNPKNKYEYVIGELKWWRGEGSMAEVFHQATKKHVTGQEKEIYIIILSKNKNIIEVKNKIIDFIMSKDEIDNNSLCEDIAPRGSKEIFISSEVCVRYKNIPIIIGIIDLYHMKE